MQPERREVRTPGGTLAAAALVVATAAAALSGCTGSDPDAGTSDGKAGAAGQPPTAPPGKYRTLPEACGAVSDKTLRALLPATGEHDEAKIAGWYEGRATVTYDTDRRVGCRWTVPTQHGSHRLTLDFLRVVSYDTAVSDDDRARETYEDKATAAHVPDGPGPGASASASASATTAPSGASGTPSDAATSPDTDSDTGTSGAGAGATDTTAPRRLADLADDAFLTDRLSTTGTGAHADARRDVSIVFRSSNVIATLTYDETSTAQGVVPSSADLQVRARQLAQELTRRFIA